MSFRDIAVFKVLQLIPTLDRSGAEKQAAILARGLPRDRFRVEVAALTRLGPLAEELEAAGVPVTLIGKRLKIDPFCLERLVRFIRDKKFDVVHTWIFAANCYGRVAARRAGVRVVVTSEMAVDLWKGKGHFAIDRRLARITDRIVGNSQAVVDFYRHQGIPSDKLAMIRSGIEPFDPPAIDRAEVRGEFGVSSDQPLVVYAGRLAPQKGLDDLLFALDLLQHVMPDVRTLIVGAGPLRTELEELARMHKLEDKVRFLGHRDDVPRLFSAADVVVLPSLYEGLPNVVLEAMMCGKPVVATSAPGTTEVVVDGETGLLVPPRKPAEITRALRAIILDPERAAAIGRAGRERALADFKATAMIDRFAQLYQEIYEQKAENIS
jgi:glycosyltransferase involved in cell wall biosynthesis